MSVAAQGNGKTRTARAPKAPTRKEIVVAPVDVAAMLVEIEGVTPYISHRFAEKAIRQMLEKHTGTKKAKAREKKVPHDDFLASMYTVPDDVAGVEGARYFIPAVAFKKAIVDACRYVPGSGLTMTSTKTLVFVAPDRSVDWPPNFMGGPLLRYESLEMREDYVRVATTTDIRHRAMFSGWSVTLAIEYASDNISAEQILNLLQKAGWHNGVGEWRPSAGTGGEFGRFRVVSATLIEA